MHDSQFDWVIFDAVGTVISPEPSVARAYWEAGKRFGSSLNEDEIRLRFQRAFGEKERDHDENLATSEEIERRWWRDVVGRVFDDISDPDACFEALFAHFAAPSSWRWYEDIGPTLQSLNASGLRIGIASNFDSRLHGLLDACEFSDLISLRVISSLIGFRKPSPRFFQAVCESAGTSAKRILFVGDDPTNDIAGANAAGLAAIRIDRHDKATALPDTITDLRQILPLLKKQ